MLFESDFKKNEQVVLCLKFDLQISKQESKEKKKKLKVLQKLGFEPLTSTSPQTQHNITTPTALGSFLKQTLQNLLLDPLLFCLYK